MSVTEERVPSPHGAATWRFRLFKFLCSPAIGWALVMAKLTRNEVRFQMVEHLYPPDLRRRARQPGDGRPT